jgi:replicative DNA helicase
LTENYKTKTLPIITQREAIEQANKKIEEAMRDQFPGLISRWSAVNRAMGGAFKFNEITYLAGPSGGGKSMILNMLREDFAGKLNSGFRHKFKILAFSFEMSAADEIVRTYSSVLKTSYSTLMSSYTKITEEYLQMIKNTSSRVDNDIIHYVEIAGNREKILATVDDFHNRYPDHKLIITIDHSLLMEYLDEKSEVELVSKFSSLAMYMKKRYGALIIMLGQLNDKIEQPDRLKNPLLHFPKKTDIHGSKSVFFTSDSVIVVNRPELLQLEYYGKTNIPTQDLVVWHVLKSRLNGQEGIIKMKQDFAHGTLIYPYEKEKQEVITPTTLF